MIPGVEMLMPNEALQLTTVPLRSTTATELRRYIRKTGMAASGRMLSLTDHPERIGL